MYAVELKDISKVFVGQNNKEFRAADNVNLQIAEGEFFAMLGPSGCGKTTLLRTIAGFESPTSGEVYIHGEPMRDRPPFHRPVNTVFQNYALFPHLTVAQNVAFGLEMEGLSRADTRTRVGDALALVKLDGMENRRPRQLSGGQQQRVALARALVKKPKVLLFDEPLAALDLKLRKEMQFELKQMQQQVGITFIFVTHDQGEALTMSHRIAVMNAGKVLQVGTPTEIYEEPTSRFVADFIGETNFLTGQVREARNGSIFLAIDEILPLEVADNRALSPGQFVTLAVRPEKVSLYPENYDKDYCVPGVVEEAVYIGTDTRYIIRLTPHHTLAIRRQNLSRSSLNSFAAGETVQVRLHPESIRIIEERE